MTPRAAAAVLDGRELALVGYPQATRTEDGAVHELILTRFPPGCCFGALPVLDEWVAVTPAEPLEAGGLGGRMRVRGRLSVGEQIDPAGFVTSLYRLAEAEVEAVR